MSPFPSFFFSFSFEVFFLLYFLIEESRVTGPIAKYEPEVKDLCFLVRLAPTGKTEVLILFTISRCTTCVSTSLVVTKERCAEPSHEAAKRSPPPLNQPPYATSILVDHQLMYVPGRYGRTSYHGEPPPKRDDGCPLLEDSREKWMRTSRVLTLSDEPFDRRTRRGRRARKRPPRRREKKDTLAYIVTIEPSEWQARR